MVKIVRDFDDLGYSIEALIQRGKGYACFPSSHLMMEARRNGTVFHALSEASFLGLDGQPVVWLARWKHHLPVSRVPGPDAMKVILANLSNRGKRVGMVGGNSETLHAIAKVIRDRYEGVSFLGSIDPGRIVLGEKSSGAVIRTINSWNADLIFVSLGAPKQEVWMSQHVNSVEAPMLGVGAAFGFMTGEERRAPSLLGPVGLEWFWRWIQHPVGMSPRYYASLKWIVHEFLSSSETTTALFSEERLRLQQRSVDL